MSEMSRKVSENVFDVSSTDDSTLWLEWNDAALNKENWAFPKNGPDGLFLDTQIVQLPSSLNEPHEWIRAKDLPNLTEPLTVIVNNLKYSDFIINNRHLLHSQFVRWFISAIINLQYCGRNGLEINGESNNFFWIGRNQPWQGWMNVYSMNKAGKGVQHRPVINPNGKYIVRLYFLGTWRRIVVDDMIPVNKEKLPLLPRANNNFELWPMILSKALLKLCSLTWNNYEIIDFHPVACLTGWVCLKIKIHYQSPQDKWDFLRKYADHFEWEKEDEKQENQEVKTKRVKEVKKSKETMRTKKSKDTDRTGRTDETKKSKNDDSKIKALIKPQPVSLFINLSDIKNEIIPEFSPCLSHFIYVDQSRDIPLDPKDVRPPLAKWKFYRWLKWAISEEIIDPVEYFVPIRSLKIVSPLKKCEESVYNKYDKSVNKENNQNNKTTSNRTAEENKVNEKSKNLQKDETTLDDICFWADFNKIEPYIKEVDFFYKLDYFQYTMRLSDRFATKPSDEKSETKKDSKKDSKKESKKSSPSRQYKDPEFIDTYLWPQKMLKSRNDPLYIFTDSVEEKFFLINFSTFQVTAEIVKNEKEKQKEEKEGEEMDEGTNPKTLLRAHKGYLAVEKNHWFRKLEKPDYLIFILTAGTKATILEIKPGRHILQVYCHSDSNCYVSISSDTIFHVGDRRKMYQLMCTESEMVEKTAKHISNCVSNAFQAFGTERYPKALKLYYASYIPFSVEEKKKKKMLCQKAHEYFIKEMANSVTKIIPENELPNVLRALRIFFLNHKIGLQCYDEISIVLRTLRYKSIHGEDLPISDTRYVFSPKDEAASVIQSFFKMITLQKYLKMHKPQHEKHNEILQNLLKITELFNYNKQESLANSILRNIVKYHDTFYDVFYCSKDFEYILQSVEFKGTLTNLKPNQWFPIIRIIINPPVGEVVFANINLFINLLRYDVRVFDNEIDKEILRIVNNVVPTRYEHTKLGYTLFCYGWTDIDINQMKELPWTLNIITMKGQSEFQFLINEVIFTTITPPALVIEELCNTYIPNSRNYISKWIIRVMQSSIVSFRLQVSYSSAKIRLKVKDEHGNLIARNRGFAVVILPVVYLKFKKKLEKSHERKMRDYKEETDIKKDDKYSAVPYTIYYLEGSVLGKTWPLTRAEWSIVSEFKVKPSGSLVRTKLPSNNIIKKNESSRSKKNIKPSAENVQTLESPYWILQVITDSGSKVEIFEDRTKELEIAEMKEMWAKENPDSLERGKEIRKAFIKKHAVKQSIECLEKKASNQFEKSSMKKDNGTDAPQDIPCMEERTLSPPPSLRRLPPLDLSVYEVKDDEEILKTESKEEMQSVLRKLDVTCAQQDYVHFLEELENLNKLQKLEHDILYRIKYTEAFRERKALMENLYEIRKNYIAMKSLAPSVKSVKKSPVSSKKSKKKK